MLPGLATLITVSLIPAPSVHAVPYMPPGGRGARRGRGPAMSPRGRGKRWAREPGRVRSWTASTCWLVAALIVMSKLTLPGAWLELSLPHAVHRAAGPVMGVPGLGYPAMLIVLAGSLHRGRRSAWWLLAILVTAARPLSGVAIASLQHGPGILGLLPLRVWAALMAQVLLLGVLTATWPCFQARGDRVACCAAVLRFCCTRPSHPDWDSSWSGSAPAGRCRWLMVRCMCCGAPWPTSASGNIAIFASQRARNCW